MLHNVTNNYVGRNTESYCDICWRERKMSGMTRGIASKVTKAFALRLIAAREGAGYEVKRTSRALSGWSPLHTENGSAVEQSPA